MDQLAKTLEKLDSFDADLRYMGLCDLINIIESDVAHARSPVNEKIPTLVKDRVVARLTDDNSEVQTQAIRTLGSIVVYLNNNEVLGLLPSVVGLPPNHIDDIKELALRAIITNCRAELSLAGKVVEIVLPALYEEAESVSIQCLSVFGDLIARFGSAFSTDQIETATIRFEKLTVSEKGLIRKRSIHVMALIAQYMTDEQWKHHVEFITNSKGVGKLLLVIALCGSVPEKATDLSHVLDDAKEMISTHLQEEYAEEAETALLAINALVSNSGISDLKEPLGVASSLIQYNPNLALELMDEDDDLNDSEFEDEDYGTDDHSWKIRRVCARIFSSIAKVSPQALHDSIPLLLKSLSSESDQGVKTEILTALQTCTQKQIELKQEPFLASHLKTLVTLVSSDTAAGNLDLLETLCPWDAEGLIVTLLPVIGDRIKTHKLKQLSEAIKLIHTLIETQKATLVQPYGDVIQSIVALALKDFHYQTQNTAILVASQCQLVALVPEIQALMSKDTWSPMHAVALPALVELASKSPPQVSSSLFDRIFTLISTTNDLQLPALAALEHIDGAIDPAIAEKIVSTLEHLLTSSRTIVVSVLHVLPHIIRYSSTASNTLVGAVLGIPDDAQTVELKCAVLSKLPQYDQVMSYAFTAGHSGYGAKNLISLFGVLAHHYGSQLYDQIQEGENLELWAEISAEILDKSGANPTNLNLTERSGLLLVRFLAQRQNPHIPSLEDLMDVRTAHLHTHGAAIGAVAKSTGRVAEVLTMVDSQDKVRWLSMLKELTDEVEYATQIWDLISNFDVTSTEDLELLGEVGGGLVVSTGKTERLSSLGQAQKFYSARKAFDITDSRELRKRLVAVFIELAEPNSAVSADVRLEAMRTLMWTLQIHGELIAAFAREMLDTVYSGVEIDDSKIRVVEIGPFKHEIDDGLPLRIAAYEALHGIVSKAPNTFTSDTKVTTELVNHLIKAFADAHEVQLLSSLIISELAKIKVEALLPRISEIVSTFQKIWSKNLGEKSLKQDHERQSELCAAVATTAALIHETLAAKRLCDPELASFVKQRQK